MEFTGIDYSSTQDSSVFNVCSFSNGKMNCYEITRKEYFLQVIREQAFF